MDLTIESNKNNILRVTFLEDRPLLVSDVLTNIKRWQAYTDEYLEKKVNNELPKFLQKEMGEISAKLCDFFPLAARSVYPDGSSLIFSGGKFQFRFFSKTKKKGSLQTELLLEKDFPFFDQLPKFFSVFSIEPIEMCIFLYQGLDLSSMADRLRKNQWQIMLQLPEQLEARKAKLDLCFSADSIRIKGFSTEQFIQGDESLLKYLLDIFLR